MEDGAQHARTKAAWAARILIGGLVSAAASASWFISLSPVLFFLGQGTGLGTAVLFLLRRPEKQPIAGLGFALAAAAVLVPVLYWFSLSLSCCD
jgi:hypothetical protein